MSSSSSRISESRKRSSQKPAKDERLRRAWRRGLTPPPWINLPDWADRYRRLAKEAGSTSGKWRTSTVEVARGPMLAVTEPGVHVLTAMVCTQLLKTALLETIVGYHAHIKPVPMLLVQPKEAAAEQFSKERISPMIRATPVLRDLMGSRKSRSAEETLLYKGFPGGFLALAGAGSPDNLARRPVCITMYDEVDKYVLTREGDAIGLGDERQATFSEYLSVRVCSPTIEGESRIEASYLAGDQRQASVECPHCRHRNFIDFFRHVEWDKELDEAGNVIAHHPRTAKIYCEACGVGWDEGARLQALKTTRWHQTKAFLCCGKHQDPLAVYEEAWRRQGDSRPADPVLQTWDWWAGPRWAVYRARCQHCGKWPVDNEHASFTAGKLFSPWPKDAPPKQATKWLDMKDDPDQRVVFDNTQRGRPHRRATGKDLKAETLAARAETWPGEVPDGVGLITVGGDTQDDRVELEFVGWGTNEESWSLGYVVIEGDTSSFELWDRVDEQLLRTFRRADGRAFAVEAACIDSGGHRTNEVYAFAKARLGRKVWAIKGASEKSGQRAPIWPTVKPSTRKRSQYKPTVIGVNAAKDTIRARLEEVREPGPGFMHFHAKRELAWYEQLIVERRILKVMAGSRFTVWECPKGKANEALDCRVYAYAALQGLIHFGLRLNERTEDLATRFVAIAAPEMAPAAEDAWISRSGADGGESWL
ncbi:phage terminase large subunit family protein [Sphingomonas profundi]|uniref:phage terminase large subunit family protein n=1 Tax=Alterirhizorhabdus profundi TaxID=2681549 RepID=UPI0012E73D61|nr:terminase gpA endonuclease subunit [Sphingomonas profundi]